MDCAKIGKLILQLRSEKGLTQRQVAERLNISNKTISKWECGRGCPDVSLWEELADVLGADILKLLQGELNPNRPDTGKIDNIRFYVCSSCGNILTSTGNAEIACCGRRLYPKNPEPDKQRPEVLLEETDLDYYVTVRHEMSKKHYISFAAYVYNDRIWFQRLYPEQNAAFRIPAAQGRGNLYLYCVKDGLFRYPDLISRRK